MEPFIQTLKKINSMIFKQVQTVYLLPKVLQQYNLIHVIFRLPKHQYTYFYKLIHIAF
jgi:hypothetical protein